MRWVRGSARSLGDEGNRIEVEGEERREFVQDRDSIGSSRDIADRRRRVWEYRMGIMEGMER